MFQKRFTHLSAFISFHSFQSLLDREGFSKLLLKGPNKCSLGNFSDVCDGQVYQTFVDCDGNLFFQDKRNIGLMLNLDWFQPYKNSEYSLGVLYCVIINLPREVRFKWENVIVLAVIPGPTEPKLHINSYLEPHVEDLQSLWNGESFLEKGDPVFYRVAVFCMSSDIPATRKLGGFKAHNALSGMFTFFLT